MPIIGSEKSINLSNLEIQRWCSSDKQPVFKKRTEEKKQ